MAIEVEALISGLDYVFDPNTGIFYIDRTGWPASPRCNLHSEQWIFDARKTYPCETAQHMRRITDKICEGYIEANNIGASVPDLAYSEKRDDNLESDIAVTPPNSYASGSGEPYDINVADFSGTDGAHSYERMQYPTATWKTGLFSQDLPTPYYCGAHWVHLDPPSLYRLQYRFVLLAMYPITPLMRGGAAAIKTATINVEIKNGSLREYEIDKTGPDEPLETVYDETTDDASLMRLRAVVVKAEGDGRYSFVGDAGLTDGGTLTRKEEDGDVYYRGTLEIQTLLKASYAFAASTPGCFIALLWAPPTGGAESNEELGNFRDWVLAWSATFSEGVLQTYQLRAHIFYYSAMQISSPMVQFDPDYLDGGPNLHYDSTGHAAMPNLLYEP